MARYRPDTRGERNGRARLTWDLVRRLRAGEWSLAQFAALVGCEKSYAWRVRSGRLWRA